MSNSLAIAAVTATLRQLLHTGLNADVPGADVTIKPLDKAVNGTATNKVNLFLYQTQLNAALRNMDLPLQGKPGETAPPPLALDLYYLLTAYGAGDDETEPLSHRLLGRAMRILHDHPVLGREEIRNAFSGNDLHQQIERIRITPQPLSLDELSKLWTTFQTQYRLSTAYQISVVLIESTRPVKTPLPVLKRGEADRGVTAVAGAAPHLKEIRLPRSQPAARLGENIVLIGEQLTTVDAVTRFTSLRLPNPIELAPAAGDKAGELRVHFPDKTEDPNALSRWAPGFYTLALVVRHSGMPAMASNELAVALAPQVTVTPRTAAAGTVNLTITCEPRVIVGQRILLLFGERQVEPQTVTTPADTAQPTTLTFAVPNVADGKYLVRLRVDGVDSIPVTYSETPPVPSFDPNQQVTIT